MKTRKYCLFVIYYITYAYYVIITKGSNLIILNLIKTINFIIPSHEKKKKIIPSHHSIDDLSLRHFFFFSFCFHDNQTFFFFFGRNNQTIFKYLITERDLIILT